MAAPPSKATAGAPERCIYLDHAATTPLRREALEAMLPYLTDGYANPSGLYSSARAVRRSLDEAREELAECLGCLPGDVVFTSGGTEADNLALRGVHDAIGGGVVVSAVEHRAVLRPAEALGAAFVPVGADGVVDLDALEALLDGSVALVSVMLVNSEVGVIEPLSAIVDRVRARVPGALVHCDAVQAMPWLDVADKTSSCDLVSVSAHKFGGPKGVGALVVRGGARSRLVPLLRGGSQERDLRAGTENVAGAVGMAVAARRCVEERAATVERVGALRNRFVDGLLALGALEQAGARALRVAGNAHVRFPLIEAEELLLLLDTVGIAASAGSACASGAHEPSHVLSAMGWSAQAAREAVRFTLGTTTTDAEIDAALDAIEPLLDRLRGATGTDAAG